MGLARCLGPMQSTIEQCKFSPAGKRLLITISCQPDHEQCIAGSGIQQSWVQDEVGPTTFHAGLGGRTGAEAGVGAAAAADAESAEEDEAVAAFTCTSMPVIIASPNHACPKCLHTTIGQYLE